MKVTMNNYRLGIIVGAIAASGVMGIIEGLEILINGGLVIPWTTKTAAISVVLGVILIGLSLVVHRWWKSMVEVVKTQREA